MVKTQFAQKICLLRSDNAKEYKSGSFASYLSDKGIIHQTSCAHTPQQNGVAERKNRYLLDVTRCLLSHMHVPKQFWNDAALTACYLINWMTSSVLDGVSPHSLLYPSSSPFSLPLKVFGCVCYVYNLSPGFASCY
jgi:transposase InsO family protein